MHTPNPQHAPLVHVTRGGFVESIHNGTAIILGPDGTPTLTHGEPNAPIYPRSALKPLQALVMKRLGYNGTGTHLALASASHSGEPIHTQTVTDILTQSGLTEAHLRNTPDIPFGTAAHKQAIENKQTPTPLHQNCSGKHAAMLATCVHNGWDLDTYLDPQHPLQQALKDGIENITGEPIYATTTDGCGAPLFLLTLTALAKGFAHIGTVALADPDSFEADVYNAIVDNPEHLAGSDRDTTAMMRAVPGLMCKDGAEAVHAGVLPDGTAFAVKIGDGTHRARTVTVLRILEILGYDVTEVRNTYGPKVLGHGNVVGEFVPQI